MKVYGIFNGEYSDWGVVGYYTSREEAEKRCAVHNNILGFDDEYVMELECLDGKMELPQKPLYYLHTVVFDNTEKGWVMRNDPERYKFSVEDYDEKESSTIEDRFVWIAISVKARKGIEDRKRVEKIAQDRLYKYLAEKNGIA